MFKCLFCVLCATIIVSFCENTSSKSPVCFKQIGCFPTNGSFYHSVHRPFELSPYSPVRINTTFELYTRRNPNVAQSLFIDNQEGISKSNFLSTQETKLIVHGWLEHWFAFPTWIQTLKDQLLIKDNFNVIVVTWKGGNNFPYEQATSNTRVAGAQIALFIKFLMDTTEAPASSFHIIGHSLGAHVAGYAGERISQLGRITGLDPARPYFEYMPSNVRLDPTDAQVVDVIHSDTGPVALLALGMRQPCGHVDFYPNGGEMQPGCLVERATSVAVAGISEGLRRLLACPHQRAVDFFSASINSWQCKMVAYPCSSYEDFKKGLCVTCTDPCPYIGLDGVNHYAQSMESIQVYLKTRNEAPFCLMYFIVHLTLDEETKESPLGVFDVTLIGNTTVQLKLSEASKVAMEKNTVTFMVDATSEVGIINNVVVKWKYERSVWKPTTWFHKAVMFLQSLDIRKMYTKTNTFCNQQSMNAFRSNEVRTFMPC